MNSPMMFLVAALVVAAIGAFCVYRWRQRTRVLAVKVKIKEYLCQRFGQRPDRRPASFAAEAERKLQRRARRQEI